MQASSLAKVEIFKYDKKKQKIYFYYTTRYLEG